MAAHRRSRLSPDGELFVCGRAKDIIIVNGRKYHPQDLEWAVDDVDGVRRGRVVAFGAVAPGGADRVVIVVETERHRAADGLADAIRRRIGDVFGCTWTSRGARPERHHRPDDERQGAAGGDEGAV